MESIDKKIGALLQIQLGKVCHELDQARETVCCEIATCKRYQRTYRSLYFVLGWPSVVAAAITSAAALKNNVGVTTIAAIITTVLTATHNFVRPSVHLEQQSADIAALRDCITEVDAIKDKVVHACEDLALERLKQDDAMDYAMGDAKVKTLLAIPESARAELRQVERRVNDIVHARVARYYGPQSHQGEQRA